MKVSEISKDFKRFMTQKKNSKRFLDKRFLQNSQYFYNVTQNLSRY